MLVLTLIRKTQLHRGWITAECEVLVLTVGKVSTHALKSDSIVQGFNTSSSLEALTCSGLHDMKSIVYARI